MILHIFPTSSLTQLAIFMIHCATHGLLLFGSCDTKMHSYFMNVAIVMIIMLFMLCWLLTPKSRRIHETMTSVLLTLIVHVLLGDRCISPCIVALFIREPRGVFVRGRARLPIAAVCNHDSRNYPCLARTELARVPNASLFEGDFCS